jgi:hypothetical protein
MKKSNATMHKEPSSKTASATSPRESGYSPNGLTLPEQFFNPASGSYAHWTGARGLMLGVLHEALATWFRYRKDSSVRGQRLFQETHDWFWSQDNHWLYAFENICMHLELDPDYIRQRLANPRSCKGTPQMPVVRRQTSYSPGREALAA